MAYVSKEDKKELAPVIKKVLAKYGVKTTFYDPMIGAEIEDLITQETKVIFTESPGSLTFEVQDILASLSGH